MVSRKDNNKNRQSFSNIIPEEDPINRGLLFYNLPHRLLIHSGLYESQSDYVVQATRILKNDPNIGADDQYFRKFRECTLTREDVVKEARSLYPPELADTVISFTDDLLENKTIGAWSFLSSPIIRELQIVSDPEVRKYLEFILALCDVDEKFLTQRSQNPDFDIDALASEWFILDTDFKTNRVESKSVQFNLGLLLHWMALFEHYLDLTVASKKDKRITFNKYLPKSTQTNKLTNSVNVFLEKIKNEWLIENSLKNNWEAFFSEISSKINEHSIDGKEVDAEAVKKQINRIRKGKNKLTINIFIERLAILNGRIEVDDTSPQLLVIPFIQVISSFQDELLDYGLEAECIERIFQTYPAYIALVSKRFKEYCKTGQLKPQV